MFFEAWNFFDIFLQSLETDIFSLFLLTWFQINFLKFFLGRVDIRCIQACFFTSNRFYLPLLIRFRCCFVRNNKTDFLHTKRSLFYRTLKTFCSSSISWSMNQVNICTCFLLWQTSNGKALQVHIVYLEKDGFALIKHLKKI